MRALRYLPLLVLLLLLPLTAAAAQAAEAVHEGSLVEAAGLSSVQSLSDGNRNTYVTTGADTVVYVSRADGIAALYIEFDAIPQPWTLTDPASGASVACGEHAFLHEFVDVAALFGGLPSSLELTFPAGTAIAELYAFSQGELPGWVQVWEPPCEEADLLLISSHSDDEQLFFAGVLPYYAVERGLEVQVAYVVQHFEAYGVRNHQRPHEQLDGLWTVGVRNYPVMSDFPDLYAESKDRNVAFTQAEAVFATVGVTYDDFIGYMTECMRRFKPLVVVSHDLDGEYGHGTHVLAAAAITEALDAAPDESRYPESAGAYGVWTVEKTYLHLYGENQIVMDWDTPLDSLGDKTPFEVTQEGFACHKSQHWTWFYRWIYGSNGVDITKASEIATYSPCLYGLYRSTVGPDVAGGDFFENVETYAQRAEAARLAAEEAARAEEEARRAAEEAARAEEEARREAEQAAQATASPSPGAAEGDPSGEDGGVDAWIVVVIAIAAVCIALAAALILSRRGKRGKREARH